jgi:hypothetical protein
VCLSEAHVEVKFAGADAAMMGCWRCMDREALRDIDLHSGSEFGAAFGVKAHSLFGPCLSCPEVERGEDRTDTIGDLSPHFQQWNIDLGVLLEMELAALPRNGGKMDWRVVASERR